MRRTRIFTLIMAIVWTIIGVGAVVLVVNSGAMTGMNLLIILLAIAAVAGNWLRYIRNR